MGGCFSCSIWTLVEESRSLTRDWTWAPCPGIWESQPRDHQGSPGEPAVFTWREYPSDGPGNFDYFVFLCTITSLAWEIPKVPDCHYFCPAVPDTAWFLADSRPCVEIVHMKEWLSSILTFNWILIDYHHLALSLSQLGFWHGVEGELRLNTRFYFNFTKISVQFSSVAQLCLTLCNPMNHSMPGLPVHHQLLEFTQTHTHQVGDAIQPSHPLSSPSPPAPNPSQHQGLFQWVTKIYPILNRFLFFLLKKNFF